MTYYACIKLYDGEGHSKEFQVDNMRADKAVAKAISFLCNKDSDDVFDDILVLLRKDFDELGMKMFGKK